MVFEGFSVTLLLVPWDQLGLGMDNSVPKPKTLNPKP